MQTSARCQSVWTTVRAVLMLSVATSFGGGGDTLADNAIEVLLQRIEAHQAALSNLAFVYDVESNLPGPLSPEGGRLRNRREIFRRTVLSSQQQQSDWVAWEIQSQVSKGAFQTEWFRATDGKQTWQFTHQRGSRLSLFGAGPKSQGFVTAGSTNKIWSENVFARMLFMQVNGSWPTPNPSQKSRSQMQQFQVVGKTKLLERPAVVLERYHPAGRLLHRSTVSDGEQAMVLRFETLSLPNKQSLARFQVQQLQQADGLTYPSQGSYELAESGGRYSVVVSSVIPAADHRSGWFPTWPRGTVVRDRVTNQVFEAEGTEKVVPIVGAE